MGNFATHVALAFMLLPAIVHAGESAPTHRCAAVADPSERLACYDQSFPPSIEATTLEQQAKGDFGLTSAEIRDRNPALARATPPDRIEAGVSALRGGPGDGRIIELDNGQTWRQVESNSRSVIDVGDRVSIRKSPLSSAYMLVTAAQVPVRVKRIK